MNNQLLLQYLWNALPAIPDQNSGQSGHNTTNPRYNATDIIEVVDWPEFNYAAIMHQYGGILNAKQIRSDPFLFPPRLIRNEQDFHYRFAQLLLDRVRRGLRAGFEELAPHLQQLRLVPVTVEEGGSAAFIDNYKPDTACVLVGGIFYDSTNRAPGDLKNAYLQNEYKQVLSQVNWYMGQHHARYGFVLTNNELMAVKRLDTNGRLAVSASIPWTAGGPGQLSVALGMWYVCMLAADMADWRL
ncbi:hypothetical protein BDV06DRAFT_216270 [Aspergillus oleicola]